MRLHGELEGIRYKKKKYCVRHLAYEYTLFRDQSWQTVYVSDMKELRHKISNINMRGVLDGT